MTNVTLSLGSNIGDRVEFIRSALLRLSNVVHIKRTSVIFETEAILPRNAPDDWNLPYLNMVVSCMTDLNPHDLLHAMKDIEIALGRSPNHETWGPRGIDIDILYYGNSTIRDSVLTIPHPEISNRPFLRGLLNTIGFNFNDDDVNQYTPLNSFVLEPRIVGILNITPDSFSDGGMYFTPDNAINKMNEMRRSGASVIELGAQSTRPGYQEISDREEIRRLEQVLERCENTDKLGIDSYFDSVIDYALTRGIKWINDIKGRISDQTIRNVSDHGAVLVTMLYGMDISWLAERGKYLENLGLPKDSIIVDPGLGFDKTKMDNIRMLKMIPQIKDLGYPVLVGHSRKSFISSFSNTLPADRDIETISISSYLQDARVDYLRVHNVRDHMKYFVAKNILLDSARYV